MKDVKNTKKDIEDAGYKKDAIVYKDYVLKLKEGESGDKYNEKGSYFGLQRINRKEPCPTICQRQGNKGACLVHYEEHRELTVPELKRLHSLPDDFILNGTYKQNCERIGRSVPPLMMKAIIDNVFQNILQKIEIDDI